MKKIAVLILTAVLAGLPLCGCGAVTPGPEPLPVHGPLTLCAVPYGCDGTFGVFSVNKTEWDEALSALTDDCLTVTTDKFGDYVINESVVDSYTRYINGDDSVTYTFKIKKGLKFSNGEKIEAKDFCSWILFALSPASQENGVYFSAPYIKGATEYSSGQSDVLSGLRLDGDSVSVTVEGKDDGGFSYVPSYSELKYFSLRAVNSQYWFGKGWDVKDSGNGCRLTGPDGQLPDSETVSHVREAAAYGENRITAGPYIITGAEISSETEAYSAVHLKANPYYSGDYSGRKPQECNLEFVCTDSIFEENGSVVSDGNLFISITDPEQIARCEDTEGYFTGYYGESGYICIQFACDTGPVRFEDFRHAVCCLIDREGFAEEFCGGYGFVPQTAANGLSRAYYQNQKELDGIDPYSYDPERAVLLLEQAGFKYNENGESFIPGTDSLRYRKVTAREAENYEEYCVTAGGELLMPALVLLCEPELGGAGPSLIDRYTQTGDFAYAGVEIRPESMPFAVLLNYLYRSTVYDIRGDYEKPKYGMLNLSASYADSADFNPSKEVSYGGISHLDDDGTEELAATLYYGCDPGDFAAYNISWLDFIEDYSDKMTRIPLCSNVYVYLAPEWLLNVEVNSFFPPYRAVLYCTE